MYHFNGLYFWCIDEMYRNPKQCSVQRKNKLLNFKWTNKKLYSLIGLLSHVTKMLPEYVLLTFSAETVFQNFRIKVYVVFL